VVEKTIEGLWKMLHDLYEKNTESNKVFLMNKLYNLKMEGASVEEHLNEFNIITNRASAEEHLNEFNIITNHLTFAKIILDDEIIAILLMCSMLDNQENLIISMSTLDPVGTLRFDDVSINLMNVEL
jgi:hypothetical protein